METIATIFWVLPFIGAIFGFLMINWSVGHLQKKLEGTEALTTTEVTDAFFSARLVSGLGGVGVLIVLAAVFWSSTEVIATVGLFAVVAVGGIVYLASSALWPAVVVFRALNPSEE